MATSTLPRGWRAAGRYGLLTAVAVVVLFPIWVMVVGAFKPFGDVLQDPLLPTSVTLETLRTAWRDGNLGRALVNSTIVSLIVTMAQLVTSVLSAYAFAFLRFPGRTFAFGVFLATLLVPFEATVVVNDDQLSKAIGKEGKNVRLAAKLTEWKIDAAVPGWSADFDAWAADALSRGDIDTLAAYRSKAPGMPYAHPTVEHYSPLFVTLGAATTPDEPGVQVVDGFWMGLSKRSLQVA